MQPGELIDFFARSGYQIYREALAYFHVQDPVELLKLFNKYAPDALVITPTLIRILKRFEMNNLNTKIIIKIHDDEITIKI